MTDTLKQMLSLLDSLHEHKEPAFADEIQRLWPQISAVLHAADEWHKAQYGDGRNVL